MRALLLLLALAPTVSAAELDRLIAAARAVPRIDTPFVQVKRLAMLDAPLEARGRLVIDRTAGSLRLVFDGKSELRLERGRLKRFDAEGREEHLGPEANALAAQFQGLVDGDFSKLGDLFTVTAELPTVTLEPRTADLRRFVGRIVLRFREDLAAPATMLLVDPGGDETAYTFSTDSTAPGSPGR